MNFIELPSKDGDFLINAEQIALVEPFFFKGKESIMITMAHPLDSRGTKKISVDMTYDAFKALLKHEGNTCLGNNNKTDASV